jgi:hypothetical protein
MSSCHVPEGILQIVAPTFLIGTVYERRPPRDFSASNLHRNNRAMVMFVFFDKSVFVQTFGAMLGNATLKVASIS